TALVAEFSANQAGSWVLGSEERDLLLRLTPAAFDDSQSLWAWTFADTYWVSGNLVESRKYAQQAQAAFAEEMKNSPADSWLHVRRSYVLAIVGRTSEALAERQRALEIEKNGVQRGYMQY